MVKLNPILKNSLICRISLVKLLIQNATPSPHMWSNYEYLFTSVDSWARGSCNGQASIQGPNKAKCCPLHCLPGKTPFSPKLPSFFCLAIFAPYIFSSVCMATAKSAFENVNSFSSLTFVLKILGATPKVPPPRTAGPGLQGQSFRYCFDSALIQ